MPADPSDQNTLPPLELESSNLDEIIAALSTGTPVALPQKAGDFHLANADSRAAFSYYATRQNLWPQQTQIREDEINGLLHALENPALLAPSTPTIAAQLKRPFWRVTQVRIHRFAGLHRHCDDKGLAPEILTFDISSDVTCIWGFNGAGKSAFQSAIMWCLTGKAHRSQHKPSDVHEPIGIELTGVSTEGTLGAPSSERSFKLPPIVPLPSAENLATLKDKPACDTWVELTLREDGGNEAVVRREVVQTPRGVVSVEVTGLDQLGLPQWAIEAGTLMPAIAATMRFDEKTTFADAISQLTGLKPLQEFGRRSDRLARRLSGEERDKAVSDKANELIRFINTRRTFTEAWTAHSDAIGESPEILTPDNDSAEGKCKTGIESSTSYLEQLQLRGREDIDSILGTSTTLETDEQISAFVSTLSGAKERFSNSALQALRSMETIRSLGSIEDDDRETALAKLRELAKRAAEQVARQLQKSEAARWQLYTMVSQWHGREHPNEPLHDCPVCGTDLVKVPPDALLDKAVADALAISAQAHTDAAKSLKDWQNDASSELLEALPQSLKNLADLKLRPSLIDHYREAFVKDLFSDPAFRTELQPLKNRASDIWDLAIQAYPLPRAPDIESIALPIELQGTRLFTRFTNLLTALALASHRKLSADQLKHITIRYLGMGEFKRDDVSELYTDVSSAPLRHQISALEQAVTSSKPIIQLLRQLREIEQARLRWVKANTREALLERAARAAKDFTRLPGLVHHQVEGLLAVLDAKTTEWLKVIYQPHYVGGPAYVGLDPSRTQGVGLYAGLGSIRVHAHEVMNSSHLRACVWAFVFSLWERIRERAGGLDVLQLDDPQTYFDPINTEHLAAAIPLLVKVGMAPIVTSNDNRFIAAVKAALPKLSSGTPSWSMLQLSPISNSRLTAALTPSLEEVSERRIAWKADESDVPKAQEFVLRVRLYLESKLWDLLGADPHLIHKPTLADLVNHIRRARKAGEQPFNEIPFERLVTCSALQPDAAFYKVINKAHHDLQNVTPHEVAQVDSALDEVQALLRSSSASYARFMGRLTREDEETFFATPPALPPATQLEKAPIPILGDFSARTNSDVLAVEIEHSTFSPEQLGDVALFAIRGSSLGALALPGQIVIASLNSVAKTGDPVIALHGNKVLARRYHEDRHDLTKITLTCDQSGSEHVPPAITLPRGKVRVLPIVGVLYESVSGFAAGEAYPIDQCSVLSKPLVAARIVDDSGYPVIRSGDLVLMEEMQIPTETEFDRMRKEMLAFVASQQGENYAYLKRIGSSFSGIRIFENVGTFGDSIAVACSTARTDESAGNMLKMQKMWCIHGVIRSTSAWSAANL